MNILKKITSSIGANSPTLLTATAVTGLVATAILVAKAAPKASKKVEERDLQLSDDDVLPNIVDDIKLVYKEYIPAVAVGALTAVCIISSNTISGKKQAALAGAYSLTQMAFNEYTDAVTEEFGKTAERKVNDKIASKKIEDSVMDKSIIIEGDEVLCYESCSGRYFKSTMEKIRQSANSLNERIFSSDTATLNELYYLLGMEPTDIGNDLGWNAEHKLELTFSTQLYEGRPVLVVGMKTLPKAKYVL